MGAGKEQANSTSSGLTTWQQRASRALQLTEAWTSRFGPWLLLVLAVVYYASYVDRGLNLGGEGGTTAVLAMRLMEGQRPIADTFLGYNVLWFYPVAWLFEITGPNYLALRVLFFSICTVTGLLAYATVLRVTKSGLLALATGVVVILIPGMLFRNYMGLIAVANQLALLSGFLLPVSSTRWRILLMGLTGLALGLTFLIRIEVGLFLLVIWFGLLPAYLLSPGGGYLKKLKELSLGGGLAVLFFVVTHLPFAIDAHSRGFAKEFYSQYSSFISLYQWEIRKEVEAFKRSLASAEKSAQEPNPASTGPAVATSSAGGHSDESQIATTVEALPAPVAAEVPDGRRPRPPLSQMVSGERARDRFFAAAIYFPVLLAGFLVIGGCGTVVAGFFRKRQDLWTSGWTVLVLTGCALTLFPQYFSFRPDTPHLSEFMVPFIVALACTCGLLTRTAISYRKPLVLGWLSACILLVGLQVWIHFGHAFRKESAGTIAARKHGPIRFEGLNGVSVLLREKEAPGIEAMHKAIVNNSQPGDYVVCLPYSPTINFMTDRPSYLYDLYTDNTMAGPDFDAFHIRLAETKKPAVVVIDHREINNTPASSFPNWAPQFYQYLRENYRLVGRFLGNDVFARRD